MVHRVIEELTSVVDVGRVGGIVDGREYYEFLSGQSEVDYDPLHCTQGVHNKLIIREVDECHVTWLEDEWGIPFLQSILHPDRQFVEYPHRQ